MQELELYGDRLVGNDLQHLRKMTGLKKLTLCSLNAENFLLFPHLTTLTALQSLSIYIHQDTGFFSPTDTCRFKALSGMKDLTELYYRAGSPMEITEHVTASDMVTLGKMPQLTKLEISVAAVDTRAMANLVNLIKLKH